MQVETVIREVKHDPPHNAVLVTDWGTFSLPEAEQAQPGPCTLILKNEWTVSHVLQGDKRFGYSTYYYTR